jgi:outer membrane protein OmpA-like peptidoglycan-associated protein
MAGAPAAAAKTVVDLFDFDSSMLKGAMKSMLDSLAGALNATPANESLEIVGHTDSTGPDAYNQKLSERRAQSVADYLAGKGVSANGLMGVVEDPVSGLCATWGIRAKLTRV